MTVICRFAEGLTGVRSQNADVKLSVARDASVGDEAVLVVDYPLPTADPAGRDVWCDAESSDWSGGRAISFRVKPASAVKLSVSFFDRNRVVYTTWVELTAGEWRGVEIPFEQMRPNPYFQPPDAKTGAPIDVSDVKGLAFAPQDQSAGRLMFTKFVLVAK